MWPGQEGHGAHRGGAGARTETVLLTSPRRLCLGVVHTMIAGVMCGEQLAAGLPGMYAGRSQCRRVDDVEAGKSVG